MPATPASSAPGAPLLTRRSGLLALMATLPLASAAACSTGSGSVTSAPSAAAGSADPDDQAAQEADLVARYDAVLAAYPQGPAAALLTDLRDQHAQHREALGGGSVTVADPSVPTSIGAALRDLAATEHEASRSRIRACVAATDPQRARLLAFLGASEASHVPALRDAASTA